MPGNCYASKTTNPKYKFLNNKQKLPLIVNSTHIKRFETRIYLVCYRYIREIKQTNGNYLDPMRKSVAAMLFGMLLVFEMTALLRESNEVREYHTAKADMVERYDRIGLNVFGMIIIQCSLDKILGVARCYHGLHMRRHVLHFHPLDLAEESPHRHFPDRRREKMDRIVKP